MTGKTCFFVRPTAALRPDFRLFIAFLWSGMRSVDTDGDCDPANPADRRWTRLFVRDREGSGESFEIAPESGSAPLVLRVESPSSEVAARAALFLALETDGTWSDRAEGPMSAPMDLAGRTGPRFDLQAALDRAATSVWRRASRDNPFPNLGPD
jgi:hypothetical protein